MNFQEHETAMNECQEMTNVTKMVLQIEIKKRTQSLYLSAAESPFTCSQNMSRVDIGNVTKK